MRRTSAQQLQFGLEAAPILAELCCRRCPTVGVTIIALGQNDNGAIQAGFCGHDCARLDGWPWLASEAPKAKGRRV